MQTVGTIIPKRAPGKFRIVHVSNAIMAYIEIIALNRLQHAIEHLQLIDRRQYGFTANRSRHDLISHIIKDTTLHRVKLHKSCPPSQARQNNYTTIIGLDIQGAFDNICQQKMIEKFQHDLKGHPITQWLRHFVLNRFITVKYKQFTTGQERAVCRGVPQGSALGPICWNMVINQICSNTCAKFGQYNKNLNIIVNMYTYADDLTLLIHGNNITLGNNIMQHIVEQLAEFKLQINLDKTEFIQMMGPGKFSLSTNALKTPIINNKPIKQVQEINILGVKLIERWRLKDPRIIDSPIYEQLKNIMQKLKHLYYIGIMDKKSHWTALIDSLIISKVVNNNLPIFAIDIKAIRWADHQVIKSIKTITSSPPCVSTKLVTTIFNFPGSEVIAPKQWIKRLDSEHKAAYKTLIEIAKYDSKWATMIDNTIINQQLIDQLDELQTTERRYFDPSKQLVQHHISNNHFFDTTDKWTIHLNSGLAPNGHNKRRTVKGRTAILTKSGNEILDRHNVVHANYSRIDYYNIMALINHLCDKNQHTSACRTLALDSQDAIYRALNNHTNNHDWRLIELREKLVDNKWTLMVLQDVQVECIRNRIKKAICEDRMHSNNNTTDNTPVPINQPNVDERRAMNVQLREFEHNVFKFLNYHNMTSTMKRICHSHTEWSEKVSHKLLFGKTMLMLSGFISDNSNELRRSKIEQEAEQYMGCTCSVTQGENRTLFHRALACQNLKFGQERRNLWTLIGVNMEEEPRIMELRMGQKFSEDNKRKYKILKSLTRLAFPDNNNNDNNNQSLQ